MQVYLCDPLLGGHLLLGSDDVERALDHVFAFWERQHPLIEYVVLLAQALHLNVALIALHVVMVTTILHRDIEFAALLALRHIPLMRLVVVRIPSLPSLRNPMVAPVVPPLVVVRPVGAGVRLARRLIVKPLLTSEILAHHIDHGLNQRDLIRVDILIVRVWTIVPARHIGARHLQPAILQFHHVRHGTIGSLEGIRFQNRVDGFLKLIAIQLGTRCAVDEVPVSAPVTLEHERTIRKELHVRHSRPLAPNLLIAEERNLHGIEFLHHAQRDVDAHLVIPTDTRLCLAPRVPSEPDVLRLKDLEILLRDHLMHGVRVRHHAGIDLSLPLSRVEIPALALNCDRRINTSQFCGDHVRHDLRSAGCGLRFHHPAQ